jgi:hypothetical protein
MPAMLWPVGNDHGAPSAMNAAEIPRAVVRRSGDVAGADVGIVGLDVCRRSRQGQEQQRGKNDKLRDRIHSGTPVNRLYRSSMVRAHESIAFRASPEDEFIREACYQYALRPLRLVRIWRESIVSCSFFDA